MTIEITINRVDKDPPELIDPIDCWGAPEGLVFQQYFGGKPQRDYLIGAGHSERPVSIWYDDECCKYRLSSESKKDLKCFSPAVKYAQIDATITMNMVVRNV